MRSISAAPKPIPNFLLWLSFPLLVLVVLGFASRPLVGGDDFWAHAAIGRWILEHHQIPRSTLFLWTAHVPWIAQAWGTGVVFATLVKVGGESFGPTLVLCFNVLMSLAPFVLLWAYWRRNAPYCSLVAPLFVLTMWVGNARFHARPELFTALFMTLLLLFLGTWKPDGEVVVGKVVGIMLMFGIWPNMHGAVAVGLVLIWITAFCELVQNRGDIRLLTLAAVCTLLVFVCNPRGFEYFRVWIPINSNTFKKIDEWKPFWQKPELGYDLVAGEFLLWGAGVLIWLTNSRRRASHLGWMLVMLALFLQARRQLWLTGLTSLSVIVLNAQMLQSDYIFRGWRQLTKGDVNEPLPDPMRLIARVGVLIILICAACQAIPQQFWLQTAVAPAVPVKMTAFLLKQDPKLRIYNDYEYSAYLEWGLHDRRKLYIDLNNAYPDSLMDEYFVTLQAKVKPKLKGKSAAAKGTFAKEMKDYRVTTAQFDAARTRVLDRRKIGLVAIRPTNENEGLYYLALYLQKSPHWKKVYLGDDGVVYKRR